MPNYSNGIIYKICCRDTDIKEIYIGSTTNYRRRKHQHKRTCNNPNVKNYNLYVYQFIRNNGGFENWDMVEVEKYEAKDRRVLHKRERYWIEELKASLNKIIPTRTKKEYYNDNKEKLNEYYKEYREQNKDKIKIRDKKYQMENKQKIKIKDKEKYQRNKEAILLRAKKYREQNRDKINAKIKCPICGFLSVKRHLKHHQKSKRCLNFNK